ncbi:5836_t:CDS:2, partial [Gigaspora margarita]
MSRVLYSLDAVVIAEHRISTYIKNQVMEQHYQQKHHLSPKE